MGKVELCRVERCVCLKAVDTLTLLLTFLYVAGSYTSSIPTDVWEFIYSKG